MTPLLLSDVKLYCRIDGSYEDELISSLMDAAAAYLEGAGISADYAELPLYQLAIKAYVLHFYDHRGITESAAAHDVPGLRNAITQLKLIAESERIVGGGG